MTVSNEPSSSAAERVFAIIDRYDPAVTAELHRALDGKTNPPYTPMRYHFGWEDESGRSIEARKGKLLRPALCLLACEALGGAWQEALPAAAALELLHNFTLIHDDVEDASEQRHGRRTIWSVWGEAQAINTGDGMFALAYATLLRLSALGHDSDRVLKAVQMLDTATLLLCEGQHRDLASTNAHRLSTQGYLDMIEGKTAALLATSCGLGAMLGGATDEDIDAISDFGRCTGLAFQIQDDVLGIWGDAAETGKPASDDLIAGKQSYPVVFALEHSDGSQRDDLGELLAQETRDENDVAAARTILDGLGVREESERKALEYSDAAIASLDKLGLRPKWRNEFAQIATFAAQRSA